MRRHRGFTLIELLVVVAIIALLVSILMPSLQTAKALAKNVVCRTHQRNVAYAIFLYQEDFDGVYPYSSYSPGDNWYDYPPISWSVKIGRIPDDYDILPYNYRFAVPVETMGKLAGGKRICMEGYIDLNYTDMYEGHFKCPAFGDQVEPKVEWEDMVSCQFSINGNLSGEYFYFGNPPPESERPKPTKNTDIKRMSVLIGDGNLRGNVANGIGVRFGFDTYTNGVLRTIPTEVAGDGYFASFGPWPRMGDVSRGSGTPWPVDFEGHPGKTSNITYTDGHVDAMGDTDPKAWKIR